MRGATLPTTGHVSKLCLSNSKYGRSVLTCCTPETTVPLAAHVLITPSLLPVSTGVVSDTTGKVSPLGHSLSARVVPVGAAGHTIPA